MTKQEEKIIEDLKNRSQAEARITLRYIEKLQNKVEQSQEILSRIKIIYQVHTKDCELLLNDIKKWEKLLEK